MGSLVIATTARRISKKNSVAFNVNTGVLDDNKLKELGFLSLPEQKSQGPIKTHFPLSIVNMEDEGLLRVRRFT